MMSVSPLLELNRFNQDEEGVYHWEQPGGSRTEYSDGDANEQAMWEILKDSDDVSCDSLELEQAWQNWAQEAHLSPRRANLAAAFSWRPQARVLEIGCGCGAVTRYLGERGLIVDAVEASPRRAAIARERCRDLPDVRVFCANANELTLPEGRYDYVLLVGIVEYAARFSRAEAPFAELVRDLLCRYLKTIDDAGAVLVAIENRLGFKYIAGACEDHYGVPRVGLDNYPAYNSAWGRRKAGIYTLDYDQWREVLHSLTDVAHEFLLPFPDYKLPEAVLHEQFVRNDVYCYQVLNRIHSRDYCSPWIPPFDEQLYWQAASQCGQLHKTANSFSIVLSRNRNTLTTFAPFDFIRFPNLKRRPAYRRHTYKLRGKETVGKSLAKPTRSELWDLEHATESPYISGKLVSEIWVSALSSMGEVEILDQLIGSYYGYLTGRGAEGLDPADLDLLVFNLVEDQTGRWHPIDREWSWHGPGNLTAEFVLFRNLLYFGYVHGDAAAWTLASQELVSVEDFVDWGFRRLGLDYATQRQEYIVREDAFQSRALRDESRQLTLEVLSQPLRWTNRLDLPTSSVDVFWKSPSQGYSSEHCVSCEYRIRPGILRFRLELPASMATVDGLRVDPTDHRLGAGYRCLELRQLEIEGEQGHWVWSGQLDSQSIISGMRPRVDVEGEWLVTSLDPQIRIENEAVSSLGRLRAVELTLRWPTRCFRQTPDVRLEDENAALRSLLGEA